MFTKGSGVVPRDLEKLDSGGLPLSTLTKVYSPAEIRKAIVRNADSLRKSAAAADEILAKIESENLWERGQQVRKSRTKTSEECGTVVAEHGYVDVDGGRGEQWVHAQAGHTASVKSSGEWTHSHAHGRVIGGQHADGLRRFLSAVHEDDPKYSGQGGSLR